MITMRHFSKAVAFFVLLSISMLYLVSCNKEPQLEKGPNPLEVSLNFGGEIISSYDMPLTRSSSPDDIYLIQVYYTPGGSTHNSPYAYGLFSNVSNLSITLYTTYSYSFKVYCFKEAADYYGYGHLYQGYTGTLLTESDVINAFTYSTEKEINEPVLYTSAGKISYFFDEYYCESQDFSPSESNKSLNFNMLRMSFGYKIDVENLNKGSLRVNIGNRDKITLTPDNTTFETIARFYNATPIESYIWQNLDSNNDFHQEVDISLTRISENGTEDVIATDKITFNRNMKKQITITLVPTSTEISGGFSFSFEEGDMGNDNNFTFVQQ